MNYPKLTMMLGLLLCSAWQATAQKANAVFFTSEGERFTVVLNGQKYNETPQTNVKISDLTATAYQVNILFEDQALGTIADKVHLEPGKESTYSIKKKTKTEAGKTLNKLGKTVSRDLGGVDPKDQKPMKEEFYVVRLLSLEPIAGAYNRTAATTTTGQPVTGAAAGTVTTTQQTTTTVNGHPVSGDNVSMGVSINTPEGNVNMSINGGSTYHTTGTTTTTTTVHSNQGSYVHPGYSGPYGCPYPMSDAEFQRAKSSIASKNFEDSKLQIARQITKSNCLLASQVREIMSLMTFEESKLDFAKFAYGYTLDLKNYYKVNDAFQFEASIDELDSYISNAR